MRLMTLAVLSGVLGVAAAQNGAVKLAVGANPATTPLDRSDSWWMPRHEALVDGAAAHKDCELLMIGDSITNNYDKANPPHEDFAPIWQQFYAPYKALNLGFSGDTTANVLWRLEHGEVTGLHPRAAVVLIGINNLNSQHQTAEQTEAGIDAVVGELRRELPETNILLLALLPNGLDAPVQAGTAQVNAYLAGRYGRRPESHVTLLNVGRVLEKDGLADASLYYDPHLTPPGKPLHPDTVGQRRMAEAIEPALMKLMK